MDICDYLQDLFNMRVTHTLLAVLTFDSFMNDVTSCHVSTMSHGLVTK
jgi:hypothetical protein